MNPDLIIPALATGLGHSLWQGAVIVSVAGGLLALVGSRPTARYLVLCLALAALLAAPVVTVLGALGDAPAPVAVGNEVRPASVSAPSVAPAPSDGLDESSSSTSTRGSSLWRPEWVDRVVPVVVAVWLAGVLVGLLRLAGVWLALRRLIGRAAPASEEISARARAIAQRLGLDRAVAVLTSDEIDVPGAAGLVRPVILLPAAVLSGLSPLQLDLILTHELAHVRRWDYLVNLLQTAAETLLFYHPAAWWLSRRIRIEREYCCDDLVVAAMAEPVGYARALAELEGLRLMPRLATGFRDGSLGDRIERLLLRRRPRPALGWIPVAVALACLTMATRSGASRGPVSEPTPVAVAASPLPPAIDPSSAPRQAAAPAAESGVIRHPDPSEPLPARWRWASDQARRRGWRSFTVAWSIRSARSDGDLVISSTTGGSAQDRGDVVSDLLDENGRRGVVLFLGFDQADPGAPSAMAIRSFESRLTPFDPEIVWLGSASDAESVALIERTMADAAPSIRSELAAAVTLHDDERTALPAVRRILTGDRSAAVRAELTSWLPRQLPNAEARELLERGLSDPAAEVRDEALTALADGRDGEGRLLAELTASEFPDVRSEAIQALTRKSAIEPGRLLPALRRAAFDDPDLDVQREAVDALIELDAAGADRILRDVADRHPRRELRREAAEALAERRGER